MGHAFGVGVIDFFFYLDERGREGGREEEKGVEEEKRVTFPRYFGCCRPVPAVILYLDQV